MTDNHNPPAQGSAKHLQQGHQKHSELLVRKVVAIANINRHKTTGSIPWAKIQKDNFPQMSRHAVRNLYLRAIKRAQQRPRAGEAQEACPASREASRASQSHNVQVLGQALALSRDGGKGDNQVRTVEEDVQVSGQLQTLEKGVQVGVPVPTIDKGVQWDEIVHTLEKGVQVEAQAQTVDKEVQVDRSNEQVVSLQAQISSLQRAWDADRGAIVSQLVAAEKEATEYKRMYGVSNKKYDQMESTFKLKTQEIQNTISVQATRFRELESSSAARDQQQQKTIDDLQSRLHTVRRELAHAQLYRVSIQTISGIDTALDIIARYRNFSSEGKVEKSRIAKWIARSHTKYFGFDRDFSSYYSVRNRLVHDEQACQQLDMEDFCKHAMRILRITQEIRRSLENQTQAH